MYLDQFGLNVNPFGLSHKLSFLYRSSAFEESMAHLIYGLDNKEPVVLITGTIGTGKTMALQSFLNNLGENYAFALVTNTQVNSVELLKLVLQDLGVAFTPWCDKSDLLILMKDLLIRSAREGRKILIVLDEAQNLSRDVLEEVRLLTNLGQGEGQPVQIILVGQPELENMVNQPDLAQLRQRIRVHYKLEPMNGKETAEYISHRMRVAGCTRAVFSSGAINRIYRYSGGVPRLVNTCCAEALLAAFVADRKTVEAEHVEPPGGAIPVRPAAAEPVPPVADPVPPAVSAGVPDQDPLPQPKPEPKSEPMAERRRSSDRSRGKPWLAFVIIIGSIIGVIFLGQYVAEFFGYSIADFRPPVGRDVVPGTESVIADARPVMIEEAPAAVDTVTAPEPVAIPAEVGDFYIHVSSFRVEIRAQVGVEAWQGAGRAAHYSKERVRGVDWYRVMLGPFLTREDARGLANELKDGGDISYYRIIELAA